MIEVSENTKVKDFAPFANVLTDESAKRIAEAAVTNKFGKDGFWSMRIADFFAIAGGDIASLLNADGESLFDEVRVKEFVKFVDDFTALAKSLTLHPSADDARTTQGCLDMTFEESVYMFARKYFGLPSFSAVDELALADYILAKKDDYNTCVMERNAMAAMRQGRRAR